MGRPADDRTCEMPPSAATAAEAAGAGAEEVASVVAAGAVAADVAAAGAAAAASAVEAVAQSTDVAAAAPMTQLQLSPRFCLSRNVFFVGFMGSGKSSIARRLARICDLCSLDLDIYIERRSGRKIREIFADSGEEAFRLSEAEALLEVAQRPQPCLISCGGGIVVRDENRRILADKGFTVYLEVGFDEIYGRISDPATRPLLADRCQAEALYESRAPLYESVAAAAVKTSGQSVAALAGAVKRLLLQEGVLCRRKG